MPEREVVITGMGLITPLGGDVEENWENIKSMKTGITRYFDDELPKFLQYLGKVKEFEVPDDISPRLMSQMKFLNRGSMLGFGSAREAVTGSGIKIPEIPRSRRALYIASGDFTNVGYDFMYPALKDSTNGKWQEIDFEKLNTSTLNKVNPFFLLESIHNNLFSFLSAFFEFMGSNTSLASLSPYGSQALELAYRSIKFNRADIALAVGCGNWITEIPLYELEGLRILSGCRAGIRSFRPFDRNRDGFIPAEGGAAILLESHEDASQRGAEILGRLRGVGNCIELSSAMGLSVPSQVAGRGIRLALREADCKIDDLAFISPHGSGTRKGDRSELKSLLDLLGPDSSRLPICGLKPYTGHMGAASDISEVIIGIKSARDGMVPATLNFHETEYAFRDLSISGTHQQCDKDCFLSYSYGMGGQSSSVVVSLQ